MKKHILLSLFAILLALLAGCTEPAAAPDAMQQASSDKSVQEGAASPAESDEPKEKIRIHLAGVLPDMNISIMVRAFNQDNPDYEVVYTSYAGQYDELEQGLLRMNTELMAGDPPDLIMFPYNPWDETAQGKLSPLPYISKGYLMDLDPFFDNDPEINASDLCGWNALHQYGGLYLLSPYVGSASMQCTTDTAATINDGTWTIDSYLQMEHQLSDDQIMIYKMSPDVYINRFIPPYLSEAMNISVASCNFHNDKFISLLEAAAEPDVFDGDEYWQQIPDWMASGKMLFSHDAMLSPEDIGFWEHFFGCDTTFIGYPSSNGSTAVRLLLNTPIGVAANTENPEGCWIFIKYILTHSMDQYQHSYPCAPIYKPAMEAYLDYWNNQDIKYPVEQRHVDEFIDLTDRSTEMGFYDVNVMKIIREETDIMFKGDATAEQTAKNIQDRVSLYMMEHYG